MRMDAAGSGGLGAVVLALAVTVGGCGTEDPGPATVGLWYCTSPVDRVGDDREDVEFRLGDEVLESTTLQVGVAYRAEVPADREVEVYVDGRLAGSVGEDAPRVEGEAGGGYVYLQGERCPDVIDP